MKKIYFKIFFMFLLLTGIFLNFSQPKGIDILAAMLFGYLFCELIKEVEEIFKKS